MSAPPWTKQEDQILRDNYFDCAYPELLQLLPGRTRDAIRGRAHRLGINRQWHNGKTGWTPAEDKILREMYWDRLAEDIRAALPGRSWYAIASRAVRIGLRRKFIHAGREKSKRTTDKRVLEYVVQYVREFGYGPIRTEVTEATGIAHTTVTTSVERLVKRGFLLHPKGRTRTIALAPALRKKILESEIAFRDRVKAA